MQELFDLIDSHNRKSQLEVEKLEQETKMKAILNYVLAQHIGEYVSVIFNEGGQLTPLSKFFPALFKDEEEVIKENNMKLYKAKMVEYAYRHNAKMKREEV